MEIIIGLLVVLVLILMGIVEVRRRRIYLLELEEKTYTKYNMDLKNKIIGLETKNLELFNGNVEARNLLTKQDIINKIIILILKQVEENILKYIYSPLSEEIDKPKMFNFLILPHVIGVEVRALGIVKDKEIPKLDINIDHLLTRTEEVSYASLSHFIEQLQNLTYSSLEILYRAIQRNIELNR